MKRVFLLFFLLSIVFLSCNNKKENDNYYSGETYNEISFFDSIINIDKKQATAYIQSLSKDTTATYKGKKALLLYCMSLYELNSQEESEKIASSIHKCIEESKSIDNQFIENKCLILLGKHYAINYNYSESINSFFKAIPFFEKHTDTVNLSYIYNGLGIIYYDIKNYNSAENYLKKALNGYSAIDNLRGSAVVSNNLSTLYSAQGNYEDALNYQKNALQSFKKLNDSTNIAASSINISNIYIENNQLKTAEKYLKTAEKYLKNVENKQLKERLFYSLGKLSYLEKSYDSAQLFFEKGYDLSSENGFLTAKTENLLFLYKNAEKNNKPSQASAYLREYVQLKDSISDMDIRGKIEKITQDYNLEKQKLKEEITQRKYNYEKTKSKAIIIFTVVSIAVISAISYLIYKNNRDQLTIKKMEHLRLEEKTKRIQSELEKEKYNNELLTAHAKQKETELELKNREIASVSLQLILKNNLINELSIAIRKHVNQKSLHGEIVKILNKHSSHERDWKTFKSVFEKVHPDFFSNLGSKYPNLSKTETRVCAYIKINMSNIEIASVMNITQQSLNKSRYRIRLKMGLSSTYDLDKHIMDI